MKIFDTFMFDGEFDLLRHRLGETYDLVDVIVLVEAAETFQGHTKPLLFHQHASDFAWASPKLRHLVLPKLVGITSWEREAFQRNSIQLGLEGAAPEDVILILDADEIPSPSVLLRLREEGLARPHRLSMTRHYGRIDTLAPRSACCEDPNDPFPYAVPHLRPSSWDKLDPTWFCKPGVAVRYRDLTGDGEVTLPPRSPNALRRGNRSAPILAAAGRHFSSVGGADSLQRKLTHVSHTEHANARSTSLRHLQRTSSSGVHARGWWFAEQPRGQRPPDLDRLAKLFGPVGYGTVPNSFYRRMIRTWAWLRLLQNVPRSFVEMIDKRFELLLPFLAIPLVLADAYRGVASARSRNERQGSPSSTH